MENSAFRHVMIDIETMGNTSSAAIVSIAAVRFDINTGMISQNFYTRVSLESSLAYGLSVDASTIEWWMKQEAAARHALFEDSIPLNRSLRALNGFVTKDDFVWGNSARFDLGILESSYKETTIPMPWDWRKERDYRTLVSLAPSIKKEHKWKGNAHDALDDCINQVAIASSICVKLGLYIH